MRNAMRAISALTLVIPLCAIGILGWLSMARYLNACQTDMARTLSAEGTRWLGHEVRIGSLKLSGGNLVARDVRIAEGPRLSDRGAIAVARSLSTPFDLRRMLLGDVRLPRLSEITITDASIRISRNRARVWNFADLFRPSGKPSPRAVIGRLRFENLRLDYRDDALLTGARLRTVRAACSGVRGYLVLGPNSGLSWSAEGTGATGEFAHAVVHGSYTKDPRTVLVAVTARNADLPRLAGLLDTPLQVLRGKGDGSADLSWRRHAGDRWDTNWTVDMQVHAADGRIPKLPGVVRNATGRIRAASGQVQVDLDARWSGAGVRVQGTLADFRHPRLDGNLNIRGADLRQISDAVGLTGRYPWTRDISLSADADARVHGPLDDLSIDAAGPVVVRPTSARGVSLEAPSRFAVRITGTTRNPRIQATGELPAVRYRGRTVTDLAVRASYAQGAAAVDFRGKLAGGWVSGRADAHMAKGVTDYRAAARARDIDLARLHLRAGTDVAGTVDADLRLAGLTNATTPTGEAIVQVHDLKLDGWNLPYGSVRLHGAGQVVTLDPVLLRDGAARLFAEGNVDLRRRFVDIRVTGDAVDLGAIPVRTDSLDNALQGLVYVRDGRIVGPWENPNVAATVFAYNAGSHRFHVDHAMLTMVGNRRRLLFETARATRAPAQVQLSGVIANPLSTHPMIVVDGSFTNLELRDVADVARQSADVSGTARGTIGVTGEIMRPRVVLGEIHVDQPSVGDYDLDTLDASIRYEPWGGGVWRLDGLVATMGPSSLTGSAAVTPDGRFRVAASAQDLDLAILDSLLPAGVNLDGRGGARAEAAGNTDGTHLDGSLTVDVPDMAINGVNTGVFQAHLGMKDGVVVAQPEADGRPAITAGPGGNWLSVDNLRYDPQGDVSATGQLRGIPVDVLRRLILSSSYFLDRQESLPQEWLKPEEGQVAGELAASVQVSGPAKQPTATLAWNTAGMRMGSQPISTFTGRVSLDREHVDLADLRVEATDAVFTAHGSLRHGVNLDGGFTIEGLTMDQLRHWLPAGSVPDGLTGAVELVDATATGSPDAPRVEASIDMKDLVWRLRDETTGGSRSIRFHRVNLARAMIADGRLNVDDLRAIISADNAEPDAGTAAPAATVTASAGAHGPSSASSDGARAPSSAASDGARAPSSAASAGATATQPTAHRQSGVRYEAHASFQTGFRWSPPFVVDDSPTVLTAAVRKQKFPSGSEIMPGVPVQIEGGIDAQATFRGTLGQLRGNMQAQNVPPPDLEGYLALTADRIRFGTMKTSLGDVDIYLKMQNGTVRVTPNPITGRSFSARVDLVDPVTGKLLAEGGRLKMEGALSVGDARSPVSVRLTADRVVFAESPLPIFGTGRAVGEVAPARPGEPGLDIRISGALTDPLVSGRANLARTDIRMPESLGETPFRTPLLPITPRLNLGLTVGENVRVHASQVTMDVRTPAGAGIELQGNARAPRLNGMLVVDRGTLQFPTARFAIQRGGTVTMRYPSTALSGPEGPSLAILVDLSASARLSAISVNGVRRRYTITVDARGPLNSDQPLAITGSGDLAPAQALTGGLRLTFRSDPPDLALSSSGLQGQVTGLLGGEEAISSLFGRGSGLGRALGDQMAGIFSASFLPGILENSGVLRAFGLEELSFDYNRGQDVSFRVSRQITGPLYLGYWQRLTGSSAVALTDRAAWELSASLRLRDNLQLSWTTDEQRTNAFLVEGVYRF